MYTNPGYFLVVFSFYIVISLVEAAPPEECPAGAYFPEPEDCHSYYQCDHGKPLLRQCGGNTYFNPKTNNCDWPQNVDCQMDEYNVGNDDTNFPSIIIFENHW